MNRLHFLHYFAFVSQNILLLLFTCSILGYNQNPAAAPQVSRRVLYHGVSRSADHACSVIKIKVSAGQGVRFSVPGVSAALILRFTQAQAWVSSRWRAPTRLQNYCVITHISS